MWSCDNTNCQSHNERFEIEFSRKAKPPILTLLSEEWRDEDGELTECEWCEACRWVDGDMLETDFEVREIW